MSQQCRTFAFVVLISIVLCASVGFAFLAQNLKASNREYNMSSASSLIERDDDITNLTDSYPPGALQIPYTGLVRDQITPEVARDLGFNRSTFAMLVIDVDANSPAEAAGIKGGNTTRSLSGNILKLGGDIIVAIDGNKSLIKNNDAYLRHLNNKKVGENLTLSIVRDGQLKQANLTIGALPEFLWYENTDEGIKIAYPSDWDISERNLGKDDIVTFLSAETNPSNELPAAAVFVKIFPADDTSLEELARQQRAGSDLTRNLLVTFSELGGLPAYESVFYDYADQNRTLKTLSVFTIKDGTHFYIINYSADPWRYEDYLPLARKMIESFQLVDKEHLFN